MATNRKPPTRALTERDIARARADHGDLWLADATRSRGTGLGLYICRELCERYGASIDYRLRQRANGDRNEFFVAMRRCPLSTPELALQTTP
jgi:hypothetical protein